MQFGISLDAFAAFREAAATRDWDLAAAATLAELAGIDFIRVGLREELRPVAEADLHGLRRAAPVLELRAPAVQSLLKTLLETQPDSVLLSAAAWDRQVGSGPIDFRLGDAGVAPVMRGLDDARVPVTLVVAPELDAIKAAHNLGAVGVELYTRRADRPAGARTGRAARRARRRGEARPQTEARRDARGRGSARTRCARSWRQCPARSASCSVARCARARRWSASSARCRTSRASPVSPGAVRDSDSAPIVEPLVDVGGEGGWPLVGSATMRALDAHTIDVLGVPGEVLMESAGRAVVERVLTLVDAGGRVVVCCGSGNNGGDGFVVARHLRLLGVPVSIAFVGSRERLAGDALRNAQRAERHGVPEAAADWSAGPGDVVVDALFGTGLARPLAGEAAESVARIADARRAGARVVAVDLPSGLDADTGQVLGVAVAADWTLAIGLPKLGLALEPGRSLAGVVEVARIGIVDRAPDAQPEARAHTRASVAATWPERPRGGHKGRFGHVLIAAGSEGKTGAAALAARGALRAGAGLITVACPRPVHAIVETLCVEAMTAPLAATEARTFSADAERELAALADERDALVLGPGLGRHEETQALVRAIAARTQQAMVIDADALFAFGSDPTPLAGRSAPTVLTPHPGEAARLLGTNADAINRDRVAAARTLAARTNAVVILKGAATVIAAPDGALAINPTGGPVLGTGGTGDVLAGLCGALLAADNRAGDAARGAFALAALAAYAHGAAGDRLAQQRGEAGVAAGEVAEALPEVIAGFARYARAGVAVRRLWPRGRHGERPPRCPRICRIPRARRPRSDRHAAPSLPGALSERARSPGPSPARQPSRRRAARCCAGSSGPWAPARPTSRRA